MLSIQAFWNWKVYCVFPISKRNGYKLSVSTLLLKRPTFINETCTNGVFLQNIALTSLYWMEGFLAHEVQYNCFISFFRVSNENRLF